MVMSEIHIDKTIMPEGYDQTLVTPSENGPYKVLNSEGVCMHSFLELEDAAIWRDHFFYGYYSDCKIFKML